jgi:hypothetical protein
MILNRKKEESPHSRVYLFPTLLIQRETMYLNSNNTAYIELYTFKQLTAQKFLEIEKIFPGIVLESCSDHYENDCRNGYDLIFEMPDESLGSPRLPKAPENTWNRHIQNLNNCILPPAISCLIRDITETKEYLECVKEKEKYDKLIIEYHIALTKFNKNIWKPIQDILDR